MKRPKAKPGDTYLTRLVKYIPTEIVAGYVAATGIIKSIQAKENQGMWLWIVAGFLLLLTPLYLMRATAVPGERPSLVHPVAGTLAFAAWVFASGGPFASLGWYEPAAGSLVLILVCLTLPLLERALDPAKRS